MERYPKLSTQISPHISEHRMKTFFPCIFIQGNIYCCSSLWGSIKILFFLLHLSSLCLFSPSPFTFLSVAPFSSSLPLHLSLSLFFPSSFSAFLCPPLFFLSLLSSPPFLFSPSFQFFFFFYFFHLLPFFFLPFCISLVDYSVCWSCFSVEGTKRWCIAAEASIVWPVWQ